MNTLYIHRYSLMMILTLINFVLYPWSANLWMRLYCNRGFINCELHSLSQTECFLCIHILCKYSTLTCLLMYICIVCMYASPYFLCISVYFISPWTLDILYAKESLSLSLLSLSISAGWTNVFSLNNNSPRDFNRSLVSDTDPFQSKPCIDILLPGRSNSLKWSGAIHLINKCSDRVKKFPRGNFLQYSFPEEFSL